MGPAGSSHWGVSCFTVCLYLTIALYSGALCCKRDHCLLGPCPLPQHRGWIQSRVVMGTCAVSQGSVRPFSAGCPGGLWSLSFVPRAPRLLPRDSAFPSAVFKRAAVPPDLLWKSPTCVPSVQIEVHVCEVSTERKRRRGISCVFSTSVIHRASGKYHKGGQGLPSFRTRPARPPMPTSGKSDFCKQTLFCTLVLRCGL